MFETSVPIMLSSIPDENRQAYLDFLIGQLGAAGTGVQQQHDGGVAPRLQAPAGTHR